MDESELEKRLFNIYRHRNSAHNRRARLANQDFGLEYADLLCMVRKFQRWLCPFCDTPLADLDDSLWSYCHLWGGIKHSGHYSMSCCVISCARCNKILYHRFNDDIDLYLESLGKNPTEFRRKIALAMDSRLDELIEELETAEKNTLVNTALAEFVNRLQSGIEQ